jgi:hypothetical protein
VLVGAIDISAAEFARVIRDPVALWKSERVPRVARLSSPPRIEDFRDLTLPPGDVEAIRHCRPGSCDVKITAEEMHRLQQAPSIQDAFRHLMLERVRRYLAAGLGAEGQYVDHREPVDPRAVASDLLQRSPWLIETAPDLAEYLERFPAPGVRGVESFVYWLETTYTPKPTIEIVHVAIQSDTAAGSPADEARPRALAAASQVIFASHYINGSLSMSLLLRGRPDSQPYLAYFTRAHVDGVDGWLSFVRRRVIERALRTRGAEGFDALRRRLSR